MAIWIACSRLIFTGVCCPSAVLTKIGQAKSKAIILSRLLEKDVAPTFKPVTAGLKPGATTRARLRQDVDNRFQRVFPQPLRGRRRTINVEFSRISAPPTKD